MTEELDPRYEGLPDRWKEHYTKRPWIAYTRYAALSMTVLVVAKTRIEGAWRAYADAVPGFHHELEWERVLGYGTKVPEEIGRAIFPELDGVPYAR